MQHFLLTRMNVGTPFGEPGACLDAGWLEHRCALFERYTLPSVTTQQKCEAFTWILFTHPKTPRAFAERIAGYAKQCAFIEQEPCDVFDHESARSAVASRLRRDTTRVITSRVDNDDVIARNFMAIVQTEGRDGHFLNFDLGYHLHRGAVYRAEHLANPYLSLVESRENFRGVYAVPHRDAATLFPVIHYRAQRPWMTVIHERNAANTVDGVRCRDAEVSGFALPPNEVERYGWPSIVGRKIRTAMRLLGN